MPLLLEVKRGSISAVLNMYRKVYKNELCLTAANEQNPPDSVPEGETSPYTSKSVVSLVERSAAKYFGDMILESLVQLSQSSSKEIQNAFSQVYVFCRSKEAPNTNPYSVIQSILVPGLFYIELGYFKTIDFHIEDVEYQNSLEHLNDLKLTGFIPLLPHDLKNAEWIRFCPGGISISPDVAIEKRYKLNLQKPSLLTQEVLNKLFELFKHAENRFIFERHVDQGAEMDPSKIQLILQKSALFRGTLEAFIRMTSLRPNFFSDINRADSSESSSDSDDDFHSRPDSEFNFFTFFSQRNPLIPISKCVDDMGPYERYKLEIE